MSSKSSDYQKLIRLKVKLKRLSRRVSNLTRKLEGYKGWRGGNGTKNRKF